MPQVDRVCVTGVEQGRIKQYFGPGQWRDEGDEQERRPQEDAPKKGPGESLTSELPAVAADGEPLASYGHSSQPIVHHDLTVPKGSIFTKMRQLGVRSSLHMPGDRGP